MNGQRFYLEQNRVFLGVFILLVLSYLCFQYFFIPYTALSADEFVFARHIFDYTHAIPYRDFSPYKTILGYYLLTIPMFFSHDILLPILYMKAEIAVCNALCMAIITYYALPFFSRSAILLTWLAILCNQSFLLYSVDLRVDMLTSWVCLFAALQCLHQRFRLSGSLLGCAFLISQKALWYVIAINTGLIVCALAYQNIVNHWRAIIAFNLFMILPIAIYSLIWSLVSSPWLVFYNLFYEAYIQAGIDWYIPIYYVCWQTMLSNGPGLFLLAPLSLLSLMETPISEHLSQQRVFILTVSCCALLLFVQYKQAFPYNFVLTVPAFFLMYGAFFTWLTQRSQENSSPFPISWLFALILAGFSGALLAIIYALELPNIYLLTALLPILLGLFLQAGRHPLRRFKYYYLFASVIAILIGIIYPLSNSLYLSYCMNGRYQHNMLRVANNLLTANDSYLAGIPYFYQRDQTLSGLKNLIGPALEFLSAPSDKLQLLLLPSLYLAPTTIQQTLTEFEAQPIKLIINNYRIHSLPSALSTYIRNHYQQYYGSIYLYAPVIHPQQHLFSVKFNAYYRIQSQQANPIYIDQKKLRPGQVLFLAKGLHVTTAKQTYRLVLHSQVDKNLQINAYRNKDHWLWMIKAIVA